MLVQLNANFGEIKFTFAMLVIYIQLSPHETYCQSPPFETSYLSFSLVLYKLSDGEFSLVCDADHCRLLIALFKGRHNTLC